MAYNVVKIIITKYKGMAKRSKRNMYVICNNMSVNNEKANNNENKRSEK
jgi:hypothetical protein